MERGAPWPIGAAYAGAVQRPLANAPQRRNERPRVLAERLVERLDVVTARSQNLTVNRRTRGRHEPDLDQAQAQARVSQRCSRHLAHGRDDTAKPLACPPHAAAVHDLQKEDGRVARGETVAGTGHRMHAPLWHKAARAHSVATAAWAPAYACAVRGPSGAAAPGMRLYSAAPATTAATNISGSVSP